MAGMASGVVVVGWDRDWVVDGMVDVDLCFWSLRSIADGSGSSGHGAPLRTRGPTTATLVLSVRVAGAPVPPAAVKKLHRKTSGLRQLAS